MNNFLDWVVNGLKEDIFLRNFKSGRGHQNLPFRLDEEPSQSSQLGT